MNKLFLSSLSIFVALQATTLAFVIPSSTGRFPAQRMQMSLDSPFLPRSDQSALAQQSIRSTSAFLSTSAFYLLVSSPTTVLASSSSSALLPSPTKLDIPLQSDELDVVIEKEPIGLGLVELEYKKAYRIIVKSIKEYAAEATKAQVKPGMIIVAVNDRFVEGLPLEEVYKVLKQETSASESAKYRFKLRMRDPNAFFQQLSDPSPYADEIVCSTTLSPFTSLGSVVKAFKGDEQTVTPQILTVKKQLVS